MGDVAHCKDNGEGRSSLLERESENENGLVLLVVEQVDMLSESLIQEHPRKEKKQ